MADRKPEEDNHQRGPDLRGELDARAQADQVVEQADACDERRAEQDHPDLMPRRLVAEERSTTRPAAIPR